jgi:hypothetical protein
MESPNLYEDDLTDERKPSPVRIEEAAHRVKLDPDVNDSGADEPVAGDDDDDDDEDDEDDDD